MKVYFNSFFFLLTLLPKSHFHSCSQLFSYAARQQVLDRREPGGISDCQKSAMGDTLRDPRTSQQYATQNATIMWDERWMLAQLAHSLSDLSIPITTEMLYKEKHCADEHRNQNATPSRITSTKNGVRTEVSQHQDFLHAASFAISSVFRHFREACKAISFSNTSSTALQLWLNRNGLSRAHPRMHSTNPHKSGFRQSFQIN